MVNGSHGVEICGETLAIWCETSGGPHDAPVVRLKFRTLDERGGS